MSAQKATTTDSLSKEIIITHSKYPTNKRSGYKPTSVITDEDINNSAAQDISTLLQEQVGINVVNAMSNLAKDKGVFLQGATGEYTLIMVDGVPLIDPTGIGGTFDLRTVSLSQVQRIEIIKGGQSVLYGTDAVAGVINIITTEGQAEERGAAQVSYGSYGTAQASFDASAPLSDQLSFQLNGSFLTSEGVSDAFIPEGIEAEKDGIDKKSLGASLTWKANDKLSFKPFLQVSDVDGEYDAGAYTEGIGEFTTDWRKLGLTTDIQLGKGHLQLNYVNHKTDRTFVSEWGTSEFKGRFNYAELFSNHDLKEDLTLLWGLSFQDHKMVDASIDDPSATIFSPFAALRLKKPYGQDRQFSFEVGGRYNHHSAFGSNLNYNLGASNWFTKNIKMFAQAGSSFKAPNLFQLYGQFGPNPDLEAQKGYHVNVGVSIYDAGFLDELTISGFDRRVSHVILYDFTLGYYNGAQRDDQGFEVEALKRWDKVSTNVSYTFLDGETLITDTGDISTINLRRPAHQLKTNIGYHWADHNTVSLVMDHRSGRDDAYFDNATFATVPVELPAMTIFHLNASIAIPQTQLKALLSLNNIFNSEFEETAGFTGLGRNYTLALRATF